MSPHSPLHLPGQQREPSALPLERWPRAREAQSPGFLGHNRPPPTLILPPTWVKPTWRPSSDPPPPLWDLGQVSNFSELRFCHLQNASGHSSWYFLLVIVKPDVLGLTSVPMHLPVSAFMLIWLHSHPQSPCPSPRLRPLPLFFLCASLLPARSPPVTVSSLQPVPASYPVLL